MLQISYNTWIFFTKKYKKKNRPDPPSKELDQVTLCISSPGLAPQLTILSGHAALRSPSRLHRLQDPGLNLSLLWAGLANHGNKNGRAFKTFGELVSAPGHGIVLAEIADFFNV